ncbi:hypothetical protein FC15_GL000252 [Lapidilactobacillus concavus DSM 17758]|uniref:Uncharacterized protein n=1 Tax=Lapidilactobacillus concavus DSM 17758 TaxID=1423735 RepID=A0A0R1W096_9LACO|nr:hypothetical protein FC15_GL000252 [Lapidilactobacillus concavus DSM 17758]
MKSPYKKWPLKQQNKLNRFTRHFVKNHKNNQIGKIPYLVVLLALIILQLTPQLVVLMNSQFANYFNSSFNILKDGSDG